MPYNINGQQVQITEEPIEENGRHYVPLQEVVKALGGTVNWSNETKTAQATIGQWTANIQMANPTVNVVGQNGTTTPVTLTDEPYVRDDTMYVPWNLFEAAYGYKADMQGDTLYIHL